MIILTYLIEKQRLYIMHALIIATADRANAFLPNLPFEKINMLTMAHVGVVA